jgi:hypothetical protein
VAQLMSVPPKRSISSNMRTDIQSMRLQREKVDGFHLAMTTLSVS